jgi:hypothetical protein
MSAGSLRGPESGVLRPLQKKKSTQNQAPTLQFLLQNNSMQEPAIRALYFLKYCFKTIYLTA